MKTRCKLSRLYSLPALLKFAARKALIVVLFGTSFVSSAATFRVDDRGTTVSAPVTAMRWRTPVPGRIVDNTAEGLVQVYVRLDLQQWVNQTVRLYMGMAPAPLASSMSATWRTQGKLLPGNVYAGQRTIVFEGKVTNGIFMETLQLQLAADGRDLSATQSLQFYFEIEPL